MGRFQLHHKILAGMLLGAAIGLPLNLLAARGVIDTSWPEMAAAAGHAVGTVFLRLLQMLVVPLIGASLITGVVGMGDVRHIGRLGGRALGYYATTSLIAILIGVAMVNAIGPGQGTPLRGFEDQPTRLQAEDRSLGALLWDQLLRLIPTNPVAAAAEGDMLPIIFFSLIFGVFISAAGGETADLLSRLAKAVFEVMMRMTLFVIELAPLGVLGFMVYAAAHEGPGVFVSLAWYMLTVAAALAVHALLVLPALMALLARRSPLAFFKAMAPALVTAFSTASSNATLPLTMRCAEERAGVPSHVSAFVLPLGATINMDGTALYEAVAVLFIAQALGVDLDLSQQLVVALTALLASVGAAGIPHAGTVMMVVVLGAVGLPASAVGLILAVDRVLDMGRTAVNVWSDSTATAVIAHYDTRRAIRTTPTSLG